MFTEVRSMTDRHVAQLVELSQAVLPSPPDHQVFRAKYLSCELGQPSAGAFAYDGKRPVAFVGGVPFRCVRGENTFLGIQACDAITLENYRRHGLFKSLTLDLRSFFQNQGASFEFGFPNQFTARAYFGGGLDWSKVGEFALFRFPAGKISGTLANKAAQTRLLRGAIGRHREKQTDRFSPTQDRAADLPSSLSGVGLQVVRDPQHHRYKAAFGSKVVELAGRKIWLKSRAQLWIGDLEFESGRDISAVVAKLVDLAKSMLLPEVHFQAQTGTALYEELARLATPRTTWSIGAKALDPGLELHDLKLTLADLDTF